jgi:hypothetical protein
MSNWNITHWDKPISWEEAQDILFRKAAQQSIIMATIRSEVQAKNELIEYAKAGDKQAARVLREHTGLEFTKA